MDNYKIRLPGELTIEIDEEGKATPSSARPDEEPEGGGYGLLPTGYPADDIFRRRYQVNVEFYTLASSVLIGGVLGRGYRILDNARDTYNTEEPGDFFSPYDYPGGFDGVSRRVARLIDAQLLAAPGVPLDKTVADVSASASTNDKGTGSLTGYTAKIKNAPNRIKSVAAGSIGTTGFDTSTHKVTEEPDFNADEVTELSLPPGGTLKVYLRPETYVLSVAWQNMGAGDARRTIVGADFFGRLHVWSGACGGASPTRAPNGLGLFAIVTNNPLDTRTLAKRRFEDGGFTDQMTKGEASAWGEVLARGGVTSVAEAIFALADAYLTTPLPVTSGGFVFRDSVYPHCEAGNAYIQSAPLDVLLGSEHLTGAITRAYGANVTLDPARHIYQGGYLGRFTYTWGDQTREFWVWARDDIQVYPPGLFGGFGGFLTRPQMSGYTVVPVRGMTPFFTYTGDDDSTAKTPYPLPEGEDVD